VLGELDRRRLLQAPAGPLGVPGHDPTLGVTNGTVAVAIKPG